MTEPSTGGPVRFSDEITIRLQHGHRALVNEAAKAQGIRDAAWLRKWVRAGLEMEGFNLAAIAPSTVGALYDVVNGQRAYALIDGDQIASIGYHANEPSPSDFAPGSGDRVLPVEHRDSEPFDPAMHWRLSPIDRLEDARVVRVFPVVPKSLETI